MCGRLPSHFLPFSSFLFYYVFYVCHPPLYFPVHLCTLHKLWPDNSISDFNAIMPQFRGLVKPPPPTIFILHNATDITHQRIVVVHSSLGMFTETHELLISSWTCDPWALEELLYSLCMQRARVMDGEQLLCGWIIYKEMCQTSKRLTDPECLKCSSASLNSKDKEKICRETLYTRLGSSRP